MAEDDSNSSNYSSGRNTILWGLSFGVASAIAFKAVGAIFPQRSAAEKSSNGNEKEKINPSQVIIPAININMPPNEVENISQNSQNIPSQPKPKVPGHAVPCGEVLDLYKDVSILRSIFFPLQYKLCCSNFSIMSSDACWLIQYIFREFDSNAATL
ncbi:uncharacterized protein LOC132613626 [Lycium barbarum]|uniref:uncharacterized protein LOC132613626 n=1 Tax=Lycium barbarum TaxID=112863 RepID=UPI00293F09E9|nr:uncharacterized protein LOC132613626 [Lycium barbarum]